MAHWNWIGFFFPIVESFFLCYCCFSLCWSVGRSLEPLSTLRHRSSPSFLVFFCYLLLRHEEKSYEFINHRYGVISILKRKRMRGQGGKGWRRSWKRKICFSSFLIVRLHSVLYTKCWIVRNVEDYSERKVSMAHRMFHINNNMHLHAIHIYTHTV